MAKVREYLDKGVYVIEECLGCGGDHAFHTKTPNANGHIWKYNGHPESPTFTPSFNQLGQDGKSSCHFYITNGTVWFLSDCKHSLRGQSFELKNIE